MAEVHNVNVCLTNGTLEPATSNVFAFWVPSAAQGGGITITRVDFCSDEAIAAASAPVYTVLTVGTNCAANGTVTSVLASAAWTAGTSRVGTISTAFVDATYGVVIQRKQTAANADTPVVNCSIQYVMGR